MKKIFIVIAAMFLSACSTTYPPLKSYELSVDKNELQAKENVCTTETIRISNVQTEQKLMRKKMYYKKALQIYAYSESQWTERPSEFITHSFLEALQKSHIFQNVISSDSQAKSRYILESRVDTFMQFYSEKEDKSYAKLSVTFFLIDTTNTQVVSSMHFEEEVPCESLDAKGGVNALNKLLKEANKALVAWLMKKECRA